MDDGKRGGPAPSIAERWNAFQQSIQQGLRLWQERIQHPHTQRLARTGVLTLRVVGWRDHVQTFFAASQTTLHRLHMTLKLAYLVLPVPTLNPRDLAERRARRAHRRESAVAPRVRIIVNPTSGATQQVGLDELEDVVDWLDEQGIPAELCPTERPGHAAELAREAVKAGMDMVVAAGGDGTVNDVIQSLAGHTTALGVLPMGTINVWAREMNIPLNTADAREVLLHGIRRRADLGRAGSRYFLLMSGIGFDAEVARRVEHSWLKRLGLKLLHYFATAGILSMTHPSAKIWMRSDGRRRSVNALMILIGNTRLYGGAFTFTNKALADDGMLDVVVISSGGLLYRLGVLLRAALHRPSLGPRVRYARTRTLRLEAATPLPVQVDGEVIGTLPMTFTVAPSALTVVVPRDAPADLFVQEPLALQQLKPQERTLERSPISHRSPLPLRLGRGRTTHVAQL